MDYNLVDIKPFSYSMSLINGKWKMHILFWLWKTNILRYGELKKVLGDVSHKMLSNQLRELELDNLIIRKEYPQVPPKVEYSLSEKGLSLMPVMEALCNWGHDHIKDEHFD
ncbi:helix-turn-helix domain-containing protein [Clostridium sp. DL-VIII]|uniref:winged helix-turn-helix transcriptional regulator n=1 Tax=Clostridium sp. DL-VIII TaxID=641107 RepID=UPI00117CBFFF